MKKSIIESREDLRSLVIKLLENNRNFIVKGTKTENEYLLIVFDSDDEAWEIFEKLLETGTNGENFYFAMELEGEQYVFKPKSNSLLIMSPS